MSKLIEAFEQSLMIFDKQPSQDHSRKWQEQEIEKRKILDKYQKKLSYNTPPKNINGLSIGFFASFDIVDIEEIEDSIWESTSIVCIQDFGSVLNYTFHFYKIKHFIAFCKSCGFDDEIKQVEDDNAGFIEWLKTSTNADDYFATNIYKVDQITFSI